VECLLFYSCNGFSVLLTREKDDLMGVNKYFGYVKNFLMFLATHFIPGAGYYYIQMVDDRVKVLEKKMAKLEAERLDLDETLD